MKPTKELLIELHHNQNMCIKDLMKYFNKSESTIGYYLNKFNISVIREKKKLEDLTNKTYGKLTVLRKSDRKYKDNHVRWVCICDCGSGKEKHITTSHIVNMTVKSCGCIKGGKSGPNNKISIKKYKGFNDLSATYWGVIVRGAISRNIKIEITPEDAWNQYIKQNKKCSLSGEHIFIDRKYGTHCKSYSVERWIQTASLDRIDSSKGYTIDNIQWIHKALNSMKMDMDESEFISWCQKVSLFRS